MIPSGLLILGTALRLFWGWQTHAPTMDTAIVGLMAMDIQEGARPMFFAGQGYMGALEAYLTAGIFELFGADRFTMTIVPSIFGGCWSVLLYFFLKQDVPVKGALAGALLVAFPARHILWYTTAPYGGYPEMYVFGTVMLLQAVHRLKAKTYSPWKDALSFSLFAFLGAWTNLQIFPFVATAGLVWIRLLAPDWKQPRRWLPFGAVLIALALAVIPQIVLSKGNPSSPPLFEEVSFEKISSSVQALFDHNLPELMNWTGRTSISGKIFALPYALFLITGVLGLYKKPDTVSLRGFTLCGIFLLLFSILYFPHPMAGFIPRYVIAPFILLTAVMLSIGISSSRRTVATAAKSALALWLILQLISYPVSLKKDREMRQTKVSDIQQLIDAAREQDLTHLRFVGSPMEGHRTSAYTFLAGKDPIFVSSYDERRRNAQLSWHTSPHAGYFFSANYKPFIKGSLKAMGLPESGIQPAGRFRVMTMPDIPLPELAAMEAVQGEWSLYEQKHTIRFSLPAVSAICGLRLTVPEKASLPYQYQIRGGSGEEAYLLSETQKRIGTSYISGDRVYFKGFEDQMDVFWEPRTLEWLEFSYTPGPLNVQPVQIEDLHLFSAAESPSPAIDIPALTRWINTYPDAQIVASEGVAGMLRRNGISSGRLPLPWNPRNADGQPLAFPLESGRAYLVFVESRFAEDTDFLSFGPIKGKYLEATKQKWKRFTLE